MKAIFIRPPKSYKGGMEKYQLQHPINLAYIASAAREIGIEVDLWDFEVEEFEPQSFMEAIRAASPDLVGFTSMTCTVQIAAQMAELVKKVNNQIRTVIGGPHISALPQETLREFPFFDIGVYGEGERTIQDLCHKIRHNDPIAGTPGIVWRKKSDIILERRRPAEENLDTLPFPARDLLKLNKYYHSPTSGILVEPGKITVAITSRGCDKRCIYCAIHRISSGMTRYRSVPNVIEEIKSCINQFGMTHFVFEDNNFTHPRERCIALCNEFKKLGIKWICLTRVDMMDQELAYIMADSGCIRIAFGVESGSQRILDLSGKHTKVSDVINAFKCTRKAKIMTTGFFMIGSHPSETHEDVKMTAKLMKKVSPDAVTCSIITPLPGTKIYEMMKEKGYLEGIEWSAFNFYHSYPAWRTDHFSAFELLKLQRKVYLQYIFHPKFIYTTIKRLLRQKDFFNIYQMAKEILSYLFKERKKMVKEPVRTAQ